MLQHKSDIVKFGGVFTPWIFVALAEAYLASGRTSEGISAVNEGLELSRTSEVRILEGELHRLKGELFLNNGDGEAAAQSFHDAIDLARHQSAKSWELRATSSLARLLAGQGRRDEARTMLGDIYNWFTEGFDTTIELNSSWSKRAFSLRHTHLNRSAGTPIQTEILSWRSSRLSFYELSGVEVVRYLGK
jgi:tetratricopeptide (TPR) repeat protein